MEILLMSRNEEMYLNLILFTILVPWAQGEGELGRVHLVSTRPPALIFCVLKCTFV